MARETRKQRSERLARDERARQDANATRRAEAEAMAAKARAEAEAAQAKAAAETARIQAEAEAARLRAQNEASQLRAAEERRRAQEAAAPAERNRQLALNAGAPIGGYIDGTQLANGLSAKHAKGVAAANAQLIELGKLATKALPKTGSKPSPIAVAKLAGIVKSADANSKHASDGRTEGYTRRQNGRSVFVKGYATPAR